LADDVETERFVEGDVRLIARFEERGLSGGGRPLGSVRDEGPSDTAALPIRTYADEVEQPARFGGKMRFDPVPELAVSEPVVAGQAVDVGPRADLDLGESRRVGRRQPGRKADRAADRIITSAANALDSAAASGPMSVIVAGSGEATRPDSIVGA
jgi:hypothetical protein